MLPENPNIAKQIESRRGFVSEAFHAFHQPLTALHCGLELSLLKQRSEEEYRQRIEDALLNAGSVLHLNKAVRELVEATDPGENLQTIDLPIVLPALAEKIAVVAEASVVRPKISCPERVSIIADPTKLGVHVGNLASILIRALEPGGNLELKVNADGATAVITIVGKGKQRPTDEANVQRKLDSIRADAACSYFWTLGGEFRRTRSSFTIRLPRL